MTGVLSCLLKLELLVGAKIAPKLINNSSNENEHERNVCQLNVLTSIPIIVIHLIRNQACQTGALNAFSNEQNANRGAEMEFVPLET